MNFDTYIIEAVELDENKKRVGVHHRQNRSLDWAVRDRNKLQFDVINNQGFTNVFGGTRLRYWEKDFVLPDDVECFYVVGVFYDPEEVRYDMDGNEKKVISDVDIKYFGSEKFDEAKEYARSLKMEEGAAFTNIFQATKLKAVKNDDDGKWTYILPEAA